MEKQVTEQVEREHKKKDYDSMTAVELVRELRKDPEAMKEAKRIAAMS